MKKILLFALMAMVLAPAYAQECQCKMSGREIISEINNATWSGGLGSWDFAEAIYNVRNDSSFRKALKDYIESSCTVENNKIKCR
ncbi:MAG: hypothetical protein NC408_05985 [Candidatus Gastranaerophilales bacterium]|nr:hypothetical protein [Candidatus Gastranaerophilales bacterium]MCM1072422.1 hypothetical protein [Bacteroides sp.]